MSVEERGVLTMDAPELTNNGSNTAQDSTTRIGASGLRRYVVTAEIVLLLASVSLNVVLARRLWFFTPFQSIKASESRLKVRTTLPPILAERLVGQQESI